MIYCKGVFIISTTPNYGYNTCIDALELVDRDIKHIEDKTDQNTATKVDKLDGYGLISTERLEQITHNQNRIECLGKRVDRADNDIAKCYTKSEVDSKLECITGKSALEDHLRDPLAHQELFDQKVDKREGYSLISDDEIAQVTTNKDDITALDNRVTTNEINISKTYTQSEVDSLLTNKANKESPALTGTATLNGYNIATSNSPITWINATLLNGWQALTPTESIRYVKDGAGTVTLTGIAGISNSVISTISTLPLFILPVGHRPSKQIWINTGSTHSTIRVFRLTPTGEFYIWAGSNSLAIGEQIVFTLSYHAEN